MASSPELETPEMTTTCFDRLSLQTLRKYCAVTLLWPILDKDLGLLVLLGLNFLERKQNLSCSAHRSKPSRCDFGERKRFDDARQCPHKIRSTGACVSPSARSAQTHINTMKDSCTRSKQKVKTPPSVHNDPRKPGITSLC